VIPAAQGARSGGYLKLERRVGDFATVGVAVALETSGGKVTRAGIALTGVGGSTIGATEAAQALTGQPLTAETIEQAAELAAQASRPRTDHRGSAEYKRHMVRTFVLRLLSRGDATQTSGKGGLIMTIVYDDPEGQTTDVPVRRIKFYHQRREEDRRSGAEASAGPPDPPRARPDRYPHGVRYRTAAPARCWSTGAR
jgi:Aerobic-type carbon monoxide dehydrogenase, middle subunit CoxM/CutM homologs